MSLFSDSYKTTVGLSFKINEIETSIKKAIIENNELEEINLDLIISDYLKPIFITGYFSSESNIPFFTNPLLLEKDNKKYLCTDIRQFVRYVDHHDFDINKLRDPTSKFTTNKTSFQFTILRSTLQLVWLNGNINEIKNGLSLAGVIYSMWLTDSISKLYGLDYKDQQTLSIISYFFYQSLFYKEDSFFDEILDLFGFQIVKNLKIPTDIVFSVIKKITKMSGIKDYCNNIISILENLRLRDFNEAILINSIGRTWYALGINQKELLTIALELPPTWVTICYSALSDRSYKNTTISKIAEKYGKGELGINYIKTFNAIVEENTIDKDSYKKIKDFE